MTADLDNARRDRLLRGVAATLERGAGTRETADPGGKQRFLAAIQTPRQTRPWAYAAIVVAACVPLALIAYQSRLTHARDGERAIRFSDDSRIELHAAARVRVLGAAWDSANIALDSGKVEVDVRHRFYRTWAIVAGPYRVDVTGTRFTLDWQPTSGRLEIRMHEGSVAIRGPGDLRRRVAAPEKLSLGGADASSSRTTPHVQPAEVADKPRAPAAPLEVERPAPEPKLPPSPMPETKTWRDRVAAGEFASVISEAEERGLTTVFSSGSAGDLAALADAARYSGDRALAQRALFAERKRFPGSGRAELAAFLLGRLSEDAGDTKLALRWYEGYLRESPNGSFAAEALGRRLVLLRRSSAATAVAREYLARYPQGPHAKVAREVLQPH